MVIELSIFAIIPIIPAGFAVYFGYRLIKEKNKTNIKGSVGALAVLGVFFLPGFFLIIMPNRIGLLDVKHFGMFYLLLATIATITAYILVSRFLMIREGLTPKPKGEFVGRGIISVIAVQIWLVGTQIANVYAIPIMEKRPWGIISGGFLGGFGPIIIAWVFHKVAMRFIKEDKAEQAVSSNPAPLTPD